MICNYCGKEMGVDFVEVVELSKNSKVWYHRFCDWWCLVKWLIKGHYIRIVAAE